MPNVLVAGRGDVYAVAQGFRDRRPDWETWIRPFGPGQAFRDALPPYFFAVEPDADAIRAAWDRGQTPVLEGDASGGPEDGGISLVETLDVGDVRRHGLVMAATTRAPLVGVGAPATSSSIIDFYGRRTVLGDLLADPTPIVRQPGSAALGGVGAAVLALGGQLADTGPWLREATQLDDDMAEVELVVALEPAMHHSTLAESTLDSITASAAERALPVVVVTGESTLSRHELAEWGIHGLKVSDDLRAAGAAIARTWAP